MTNRRGAWAACAAVFALWAAPVTAEAVTAADLAARLERRESVPVIDVRPAAAYAEAHIPGALHVPAEVVAQRRLPPLGPVVVCGDGIRGAAARRAAEALNAKPGIRAEVLEGGFAVWEASGFPTTRPGGVAAPKVYTLTYDALVEVAAEEPRLFFADLRAGAAASRTDLAARFPRARILGPGWTASQDGGLQEPALGPLVAAGEEGDALLVLVDDGNGVAEQIARRLKALGVGRVALLAGGELTLRREGLPGLRTVETGISQ